MRARHDGTRPRAPGRAPGAEVTDRDLAGLHADLTGGALVTAPDGLAAYRGDQCHLVTPGRPRAAVLARSTADVSAALAWASRNGVPVVPRGAGTGLAGGAAAIDGCLVLSLASMTEIREVAPDDQLAVVEAGVVNAEVSRVAGRHGLFYPPDPASFEISTVGGNVATNAGGLRCVKYGVTRDSVLGLEVVLADGQVIRTGGRTAKNTAGYDLTRLFVGSEGTLGVVTAATLRLRPRPAHEPVTFIAVFPTMTAAGDAVSAVFQAGLSPSLLELIDNPTINAIEDYRRHDLDRSAAALLIGQADGPDAPAQVTAMAEASELAGADFVARASDREEAELLLSARRLAHVAVERRGLNIVEDVGVPRSRLPQLFQRIDDVAARYGVLIATVGHAGDGNVHPTIVVERGDDDALATAMRAAEDVCRVALDLGGTITGEHGVGSVKRPWLAEELDIATHEAHRTVKRAFDPQGILNPGRAL